MPKNISSVFFISCSTLIGGILSYLYHPLMIRYLSIEDFGSFQSILSVLNLLWVIIAAMGLFYTKEVSKNIEDLKYSKYYKSKSLKYLFVIALGITSIFFLCIPIISIYLNIEYYYFLVLGFTIIFSFLAITNTAFLQSLHKFQSISGLIISGASIKLIIGFLLVYNGLGIFGALGGFIISQLFVFCLGYFILHKYFRSIENIQVENCSIISSFLSQKKQILQYLATSILIALLMNVDILIVKNMFDGETAGYYAAVSVLAKFLVFLGLSIETVYYPQLVKETLFPKLQLLKISIYYAVMTLGALGFFYLFGETILRLFKEGLQDYLGLIYPLLIYCGMLAYLSIIVKTLIAFERYTINYILTVLIVGLVVCIYAFATDIYSLSYIFMLGSIFALLGTLFTLFFTSRKAQ